ncbi:MAG TPA: hypothetical protein VF184_07045 [Phycisphaeraceae bacterium]
MMKRMTSAWIVAIVLAAMGSSAWAWHDEGHAYAARAAVEALPQEVPVFFRQGATVIAHLALDPDVVRSPRLPQLKAAEGPEHYLDLELLQGQPLPEDRYAYLKLCQQLEVDPARAGFLPYAIIERAQRLAMAFAEHRQEPDSEPIRIKCLVYAGLLAHYTADLHMPLHTTIHFNGRVGADGRSPRSGIHDRVDALPTKLPYAVLFAQPMPPLRAPDDLAGFVVEELLRSHALVDRVYELEPGIPDLSDMELRDPRVRDFTIERMRDAARFTAEVFWSAWRLSADLDPPRWLDRQAFDEAFDPQHVPPQP